MASALVTIAVGEYQRVDGKSPNGIPLRSYVTKQSVDEFTDMQPLIGEMIDWMGEQFGTYPFTEFGYVEVSDIGASLETQSMVIMSERSLFIESVLSHEMSHMWFGDWVNLDSWSEVWRNEGFATYIALMWKYRDNKAGLDEYLQEVDDVINDTSSGFPLNNPPAEEMFGRDSYDKGALLVHNLRNEVGDEAFFTGLQNYFNQYGGGSASDAQFQAIMEEAAGVSLDSFFTEWFTE
jgi:aminopeptidase N